MQHHYVDDALETFHRGYSCAQSTLAPFAAELGLTREQALRLASGFGAGLGRMRGTCGAFSALSLIAGHLHGNTEGTVEGKEKIYSLIRRLADDFKAEFGTLLCRELLHLPEGSEESATPNARTAAYYASRPCERCIAHCARQAARLIAEAAGSGSPSDGADARLA